MTGSSRNKRLNDNFYGDAKKKDFMEKTVILLDPKPPLVATIQEAHQGLQRLMEERLKKRPTVPSVKYALPLAQLNKSNNLHSETQKEGRLASNKTTTKVQQYPGRMKKNTTSRNRIPFTVAEDSVAIQDDNNEATIYKDDFNSDEDMQLYSPTQKGPSITPRKPVDPPGRTLPCNWEEAEKDQNMAGPDEGNKTIAAIGPGQISFRSLAMETIPEEGGSRSDIETPSVFSTAKSHQSSSSIARSFFRDERSEAGSVLPHPNKQLAVANRLDNNKGRKKHLFLFLVFFGCGVLLVLMGVIVALGVLAGTINKEEEQSIILLVNASSPTASNHRTNESLLAPTMAPTTTLSFEELVDAWSGTAVAVHNNNNNNETQQDDQKEFAALVLLSAAPTPTERPPSQPPSEPSLGDVNNGGMMIADSSGNITGNATNQSFASTIQRESTKNDPPNGAVVGTSGNNPTHSEPLDNNDSVRNSLGTSTGEPWLSSIP